MGTKSPKPQRRKTRKMKENIEVIHTNCCSKRKKTISSRKNQMSVRLTRLIHNNKKHQNSANFRIFEKRMTLLPMLK